MHIHDQHVVFLLSFRASNRPQTGRKCVRRNQCYKAGEMLCIESGFIYLYLHIFIGVNVNQPKWTLFRRLHSTECPPVTDGNFIFQIKCFLFLVSL